MVVAFQRKCVECGEEFEDLRLDSEAPEQHGMCDSCLLFFESEFKWKPSRKSRSKNSPKQQLIDKLLLIKIP